MMCMSMYPTECSSKGLEEKGSFACMCGEFAKAKLCKVGSG